MNKGYIISASNRDEYIQAVACAYSIMSKNKNSKVSLMVPDTKKVPQSVSEVFDQVVDIPFKVFETTRMNDWQLYWATPYEYTIAIDCKSLVKENHDSLWEYLIEHYDICFPSKTISFDGVETKNTKTQVYERDYNLKIVNSHVFYFKKNTDLALRYFKMADPYITNWQTVCAKHFAAQHIPVSYDTNIMHSLVMECVGESHLPVHDNIFTYIDMQKAHLDGMIGRWEKWTDRLNAWASRDGKIKLQNYAINNILYYAEDDFLTEDIFNEQQDHYRTVTK